MNKKPKLDPMKLTSEQRDKLEAYQHNKDMLKALSDIADMTQEMLQGFDKLDENSRQDTNSMGALLVDMRDALNSLNSKEAPETPDYAQPVVKAVDKLEKAFAKAIKEIDVNPQISVDAPQVNVTPPNVDLNGIEKLLKSDLPKAFKEAIAQIPTVDIPEQSDRWDEVLEWLESIDTASRMKPQPGSMVVKNSDGTDINAVGSLVPKVYDTVQITSYNGNDDPLVILYKTGGTGGTTVATLTLTYSGTNITSVVRT